MHHTPSSGAFGIKLASARMFGLIDNVQGKNVLTQLGFSILDSDDTRARHAKVEAFLRVPLYRKVYDEFKGKQLPPRPLGLEQAFVEFGVSAKQKDKARNVFERSAQLAGFFPGGRNDRLVMPIGGDLASATGERRAPDSPQDTNSAPVPAAAPIVAKHPLIEGLLREIPDAKSPWSIKDQANWLSAAAKIFGILYKPDANGGGSIEVTYIPPEPF